MNTDRLNVYPLAASENSYGDFKMNISVRLISLLFFYGISWNWHCILQPLNI